MVLVGVGAGDICIAVSAVVLRFVLSISCISYPSYDLAAAFSPHPSPLDYNMSSTLGEELKEEKAGFDDASTAAPTLMDRSTAPSVHSSMNSIEKERDEVGAPLEPVEMRECNLALFDHFLKSIPPPTEFGSFICQSRDRDFSFCVTYHQTLCHRPYFESVRALAQ